MPTRFYLPASGVSPLNTLAVDATWTGSATTFFRAPALTEKSNTALANVASRMRSTATRADCWGQWTSAPLSDAFLFTNAHTISMCVRGIEGNAACDAHLAYVVSVVSGDGTVDRGVIASFLATSTELAVTAATRIHSARAFTGGNVQAYKGDRIVIELGSWGVTPSVDYDVTWRFGDPTASGDFPLTAALTTDVCPWVEISADVGLSTQHTQSMYPTVTGVSNATAPYDDHDWTTPENVKTANLTYASITSTSFDANVYSYLLKSQHFDFAIPSTATITGLEVRLLSAVYAATADYKLVQLLNAGGTAEGDNNAADGPATMFITNTVARFGSPTDLWGVALTPAMLNDDDFGVQFSIMATGANADIRVDYVKITAYYTDAVTEVATASMAVTAVATSVWHGLLPVAGAASLGVTAVATIRPCAFASALTGLDSATTYHVRAYATNSVGTSYGAEVDFDTLSGPRTEICAASLTVTAVAATQHLEVEAGAASLGVTAAATIGVTHYVASEIGAASMTVTAVATGVLVHYLATEIAAASMTVTAVATIGVTHYTATAVAAAAFGVEAVATIGVTHYVATEAGAASFEIAAVATGVLVEYEATETAEASFAVDAVATIAVTHFVADEAGAASFAIEAIATTEQIENVVVAEGAASFAVDAVASIGLTHYVASEVAEASFAVDAVATIAVIHFVASADGAAEFTVTAVATTEQIENVVTAEGAAEATVSAVATAVRIAAAGDFGEEGAAEFTVDASATVGIIHQVVDTAGSAALAITAVATIGIIENVVSAAGAASLRVAASGTLTKLDAATGTAGFSIAAVAAVGIVHFVATAAGAASLTVTASSTIGVTHYVATATGTAGLAVAGAATVNSTRALAGAASAVVSATATIRGGVPYVVTAAASLRIAGYCAIRTQTATDFTVSVTSGRWQAEVSDATWRAEVENAGWEAEVAEEEWSAETERPGWVATTRRPS